jgi:hypothetical protein
MAVGQVGIVPFDAVGLLMLGLFTWYTARLPLNWANTSTPFAGQVNHPAHNPFGREGIRAFN